MVQAKMYVLVTTCAICLMIMEASKVEKMELDDIGQGKRQARMKFSAANCSIPIPKRLVYFEELKLSPNPIVFGELETFSVILRIIEDLGTNLVGSLEVYMLLNGEWTDFCPLLGGKFCHLKHFCSTVKKVPLKYCPLVLMGQPCSCPFHANRFAFNNFTVPLPALSKGIEGTFNVTLTLKQNEIPIGCTSMVFCLKPYTINGRFAIRRTPSPYRPYTGRRNNM